MYPRLSCPLASLKEHYEVVVIGSGYGGSISAARLARAGFKVCLLERGPERRPGEFPDTLESTAAETQIDIEQRIHRGKQTALFDFRIHQDINVLVGCGLGGTSLINANVAIEAEDRVFDEAAWPAPLRGGAELLTPYYTRVRTMLGSNPYPSGGAEGRDSRLRKTLAHERSADAMSAKFSLLDINVTFADGPNAAGVSQKACNNCGDCVSGCNVGAKNTLNMNYLPEAVRFGAEIYCSISVKHLERQGDRWAIYFDLPDSGRDRFEGSPWLSIQADVVVVAAGALGSTEILLRSQARGLALSSFLGRSFSGNGDVLGFAYNCDQTIEGVGWGDRRAGKAVGPCITSVADSRGSGGPLTEARILEEGSIPGALTKGIAAVLAGTAFLFGKDTSRGFFDRVGDHLREGFGLFAGRRSRAVRNTQTFLSMAHERTRGRMFLSPDSQRVSISWPQLRSGEEDFPARAAADMLMATKALGGEFIENPPWMPELGKRLTTVHPLGGCAMGDDVECGVVDHLGQVFDPRGDAGAMHQGLYVADGSILPTSVGVNPLLTISALAERTSEAIVLHHDRELDFSRAPTHRYRQEPSVGLRFTESMRGYFSLNVRGEDEYAKGDARGRGENSPFVFVLTVQSEDLDKFIEDPKHPASLVGTVMAPKLSEHGLTVLGGEFNLFVKDPDDPDRRTMEYRMTLRARDGRNFYVVGYKKIRDEPGADLWADTTTLYITVHEGTEQGEVIGKGLLRIHKEDFIQQLASAQVLRAPDRLQEILGLQRFAALFMGELFHLYGGPGVRKGSAQSEMPRWRRVLGLLGTVLAVAVAIPILVFPWRPNVLRDQPDIVPLASSGTGPADLLEELPADVAELGLFPQFLEGVDLRPGAYRMVQERFGLAWEEDNIVQVHNGKVGPPMAPEGIAPLSQGPLLRSFVNLARIRDEAGKVVGFGSQIETITFDSNPIKHDIQADTEWTLTLPGRGVLFLGQSEGGDLLGRLTAEAEASGEVVRPGGEQGFEVNHTTGPLPGGGPSDRRGIIHGGTGEFWGVRGVFREFNIVFEAHPNGEFIARTRFELNYLQPQTKAKDGKADPPKSTSDAPGDWHEREFSVDASESVYQTRGTAIEGVISPESLGPISGHSFSGTRLSLFRMRGETGDIVGLAGASVVRADPRFGVDVPRLAQWTLTIPGEGTLYIVPERNDTGKFESRDVLGPMGGVVLGGTGYFSNTTGSVVETVDGRGRRTLRVRSRVKTTPH